MNVLREKIEIHLIAANEFNNSRDDFPDHLR